MTFEQVLQFFTDPKIRKITIDDSLTDFQKAANVHAILEAADEPAKPERKARQPKAKAEPLMLTSGDDHAG